VYGLAWLEWVLCIASNESTSRFLEVERRDTSGNAQLAESCAVEVVAILKIKARHLASEDIMGWGEAKYEEGELRQGGGRRGWI
jgi:hypothetical protein